MERPVTFDELMTLEQKWSRTHKTKWTEKTDEQMVLAEEQVEVFWQGMPPAPIRYGVTFGLIKLGWTLEDYMIEAANTTGYEANCTWAERGSGKSSQMLAHGGWIHCKDHYDYEGWKRVLKYTIARPLDLIRLMKQIPTGKSIPWLGIDDIGVHMPSTIWRTDIETYQAVDAAWAAIRTKVNVIDVNIPLIDRLAKNIRDAISFEQFMGKNQAVLIERFVRLPNVRDKIQANFQKVQIEPIRQVDLYDVPKDVFKEYWEMRVALADEALEKLERTLTRREAMEGKKDVNDYITVIGAASALGVSVSTVATYLRQQIVPREVIGGRAYIHKTDLALLEEVHTKKNFKKGKKRETS